MLIQARKLRTLVVDLFKAEGVRLGEAELVADQLLESNLVGYDSHGVVRVPRYVKAVQEGEININPRIEVTRQSPSSLTIDGDWGFGQVVAGKALRLAIEGASRQGVCYAGVLNCNDVGRLGAYTTNAAREGFLAIMMVNDGGSNPHVPPWGGRSPLLSTNPIAAAFPREGSEPLGIDLSTSIWAGGKIQVAMKREEEVPDGVIIDSEGRPTNDPEDFFGIPPGAVLPLGSPVAGHKGFALGLMVDILAGALSGAGCSGSGGRDAQGIFLLLMDVDLVSNRDEFNTHVEGLTDAIRSVPVARGFDEIRIPGEGQRSIKRERLDKGIEIEDTTWSELAQIADELGVRTPS